MSARLLLKSTIFVGIVVLFTMLAQASYAIQINPAEEVLTFKMKTPQDNINDLTIRLANSEDFDFVRIFSGIFGGYAASHPSGDEKKGVVVFGPKEPPLGKDSEVTVEIKIKSIENDWKLEEASWSLKGSGEVLIPETQIDWKVVPVGDPQNLFTITNDSDDYLTFTDLKYLNNYPDLPAGTPIGSIPGFTLFESFLTIAPHSISPNYSFDELDPLKFLYIEGNAFVSTQLGVPLSDGFQFRFGHQSPIPEPSTLLLLGSGLVGIIVFGRKRLFKKA
jgi:hypothetical protein